MIASNKLRLLVALAVLAVLAVICRAAEPTITVAWDWADSHTSGYVYVGSATRSYSTNWPVSTNVAQVIVPVSSTRYVAVTAVNAYGDQSDFSNELMIQRIKPTAPVLMKYMVTLK